MRRAPCCVLALSLLGVACSSTPNDAGSPVVGGANAGGSSGAAGNAAVAGQGGGAAGLSGGGNATGGDEAGAQNGGSGGTVMPQGGAGGGAGQAMGGAGGVQNPDTPPAGVPQTYELVYSQTFAEPSSLGDLVFGNPTQWKHNAAGYIESTGAGYQPPYRSPFSVAIVKSIKVQSFVMDVEMLQTSPDGDGHRDMVLIWSFVSPSQFYYAHISTAHDGVAHNIHIVNNADRTAISATFTKGYDWGRDVWKRLRVTHDVTTGAMAVIDLDAPDPALLTASNMTFSGGYVGFGSFDNSGRVRNVKVWAESSTPGSPDFFAPAQ